MQFKCEFNMDNAAFEDIPATEAIRILSDIAEKVSYGQSENTIFDINGNNVGRWEVTD